MRRASALRLVVVACLVAVVAATVVPVAGGGLGGSDETSRTADQPRTAEAAGGLDRSFAQPAAISVESVTVGGDAVTVGEPATIEARVVNEGSDDISYNATLVVDDEAVDNRTVTVSGVDSGPPVAVLVPFEYTFEESGEHTVSVGGTDTTVSVESPANQSDDGDGSNDQSGEGSDNQSDGGADASSEQFQVLNVSADTETAAPGEPVTVSFEVENLGEERGDFEAELQVDGETVETKTVPQVGTNFPVPDKFEYQFNDTGTYTVAVSGVEANESVTVEESSGGPLGFLPMGILRPVLLFVGLPLLVVYLSLKGLALYLGY